MRKPTLTIMCGIPRCGKSTWIKNNKGNAAVVCPDEIRKEILGHQFYAPANKFVFAIAEAMVALLLKQGLDVIIDATNITRSSRFSWKSTADKHEAKIRVVWVRVSKNKVKNFAACLERNKLSDEDCKLPPDALLRMATFFEEPDPDPVYENWFTLVEYKSPHRRKLPVNKRITVEPLDGELQVMLKGEKLWGVAKDQEENS